MDIVMLILLVFNHLKFFFKNLLIYEFNFLFVFIVLVQVLVI